MNDFFLTQNEVAERLDVSVPTLITWRKKGKIAFYKIGGAIKFKQSDINKFLESGRVENERNTIQDSE